MAIEYDIIDESDLLRVVTRGCDDGLPEAMAYVESIHRVVNRSACKKILIDETNFITSLSTTELYRLAEVVAEITEPGEKLAFCCQPSSVADMQFWETILLNRGRRVRFFTSVKEGEAWLSDSGCGVQEEGRCGVDYEPDFFPSEFPIS